MDPLQSQSCPKTSSNSEQKDHSSNKDGKVRSLSDMNELERCVTRPDEMADNLDLCANDDVGNICLESQQYRFGESEQGNSQLTQNNGNLSNMNISNENTAFNLAPDSRFILVQQGNPLGIWPSSCLLSVPPYVSDDEEEKMGDYSTTSSISRAKSDTSESDTKSSIRAYIETFTSDIYERNEVRSSTSIAASSSEECRAASDVSNGDVLFDTDACMSESFEASEKGIFLYHTNIPMTTGNTGNCSISRGQGDDDVQGILQNDEKPQNEVLPGAQVSDNRSSKFCNGGELLVPVNDKFAVAGPSSTNAEVQWHLDGRSFICTECGKGFGRKHHLVSHYRTHTGEKPFACDKCGKRFGQTNDLARHRLTHTEKKPFACDICGKRFGQRHYLARHRRIHTWEKLFACDKCVKRYRQSNDLATHRRSHTGEKQH